MTTNSNDKARDYFKKRIGDYSELDEGLLSPLILHLNENFKRSDNNVGLKLSSKKPVMRFDKNGKLEYAFFYCDGDYFEERECVSFNRDGFVGFAGWASTKNTAPILNGFIEWVDSIYDYMRLA